MCSKRQKKFFTYFAIVNLKEADVGREIQVRVLSIVEIGENILG